MKKNTNIITKNNKEKKQLNNRKTLKGINLGKIRLGKKQTAVIGIILIVAIYVTYKVINLIKNPSDTFFIEKGKIYEEENAIGYIIRDEKVVKGENYKNGILQIKAEGEKVDTKIDEAMANQSTLPASDLKILENQIEEKLDSIYNVNDLEIIKENKKDINTYITKKAKIAGEKSPAGSYLKKLIDERSKYENELNSGAEYVTSPESGVVSYKVDGYENILTTANFNYLNKDFLKSLKLKVGQVIATSQESGKIIDNFKCYIACVLNSNESKQAKIFKIDKAVQELIGYRKISLDAIWWSETGKKVPNTAIEYEEKNGEQIPYVIKTVAGYTNKVNIKILKQNEKYAIVDNYKSDELKKLGYTAEEIEDRKTIGLYDEILKNAK